MQVVWPSIWRFCPQGRLITAWQAPAADKLPKVLIYNVHLQPISQLDGVVAVGGKLLLEQSNLLVPEEELAGRTDGQAVLGALHPLMQSLSGLVAENGFDWGNAQAGLEQAGRGSACDRIRSGLQGQRQVPI